MAKKTFFRQAKIVFDGTVEVFDESQGKAEKLVQHSIGGTLGRVEDGGEDGVVNWGVPMHDEVKLKTDCKE